jgi:hypothetical protein
MDVFCAALILNLRLFPQGLLDRGTTHVDNTVQGELARLLGQRLKSK